MLEGVDLVFGQEDEIDKLSLSNPGGQSLMPYLQRPAHAVVPKLVLIQETREISDVVDRWVDRLAIRVETVDAKNDYRAVLEPAQRVERKLDAGVQVVTGTETVLEGGSLQAITLPASLARPRWVPQRTRRKA